MQTILESLFSGSSLNLEERTKSQLLYLSKLTEEQMKELLRTADARSLRELNQLLENLQEWKSQRPIDFYEPAGKPQDAFHKSPATLRTLFGSNDSAKTTTGAIEAIWWATDTHPYRPNIGRCDGWVVSLDFPTSLKVVEKKFYEWCPKEYLGHWNEKHRIQTMKSGSTVQFKSQDSGVKKFQGERIRWCWGDEELAPDIFDEIEARQMANEDLDIWFTLTPLSGITWVISDILEPYEDYIRMLNQKEKMA